MRSILEKAFVALLNEEHDKAEDLFHKFIVERARQIHETNRQGDDLILDENWDEEITTESYFTEDDLSSLEDGTEGEGEEDAEFDAEPSEFDPTGEEPVDGEPTDDLNGEPTDDLEGGLEPEASAEERLDDLESHYEKLEAEFKALVDTISGDDAEEGEEVTDEFDDMSGDVDTSELPVDGEDDMGPVEDDMNDEDNIHEGEDLDADEDEAIEEDFDDLAESIVSELEKITVSLQDGKEIGAGAAFTQNRKTSLPQKKGEARQGGSPIQVKSKDHKGFNRETAPSVTDMKPRRNNVNAGTNAKVPEGGDKGAEINKLKSDGNNVSPLAK